MPEINDIDAEILRFIRAHEPTSLDSIISGLPNISAVSFRVKQMCSSGRYHTPGTRDRNDWFITQDTRTFRDGTVLKEEYLDAYRLTDLGKKVLQDHEYSEKKHRRELKLKNAWIPIIVAFVTTLLTNYMLPKLPQIIEWLSHTLSKTSS